MRKMIMGVLVALAVTPAAAMATDSTPSTKSPAKACKAERAADREAFKQKYGTNESKSNAYGKCVAAKRREARQRRREARQLRQRASRMCREERAADAEAFKAKYGTNRNKSNAFGKCVSQTARALKEQRENA